MAISGDSDEYDYLSEAVSLSAAVEGMCLELGVRLGLGTKTIIDAVRQYCPHKLVIALDPYGNIPYTGREPVGETHYDYTNGMRNICMADLWAYVRDNPVDFRFINLSDEHFFYHHYQDGVPRYHYNGFDVDEFYSMVHLDGPHTVSAVKEEIKWFNDRMYSSATIVIDDVTPDFLDFAPIKAYLEQLGFNHIKTGGKKSIWQKV